jgi:hypothetical protein
MPPCRSPGSPLAQPPVLRTALDAITMRLDGSRAAPATVTRKHAVLHAALGSAVETGLLDANPLDTITWRVPRSSAAVNPRGRCQPGTGTVPARRRHLHPAGPPVIGTLITSVVSALMAWLAAGGVH